MRIANCSFAKSLAKMENKFANRNTISSQQDSRKNRNKAKERKNNNTAVISFLSLLFRTDSKSLNIDFEVDVQQKDFSRM